MDKDDDGDGVVGALLLWYSGILRVDKDDDGDGVVGRVGLLW